MTIQEQAYNYPKVEKMLEQYEAAWNKIPKAIKNYDDIMKTIQNGWYEIMYTVSLTILLRLYKLKSFSL